jgi:hypothetical protein
MIHEGRVRVVPTADEGAGPLEREMAARREELLWRCVGAGVFDEEAKEFDAYFPGLFDDWEELMRLSVEQR